LFPEPIRNLLVKGTVLIGRLIVLQPIINLLIFQSRQSKEKRGEGDCPDWSPYGCHYQPDPEEFPVPRIGRSSLFFKD
jgi:hypothetical protein